MFTVLIRAAVIFIIVLVMVRLMGKRQIGEMQPFELFITLIIAEIACIPMSDVAIPLSHGVVPILTLVVLHFLLSFLARKSLALRRVISGNPIVVIDTNGINYENLKKMNMNINDLIEALRSGGDFNLEEIRYAIFETNGKLCVVKYEQHDPATREDLKLKPEPSVLPMALLVDGKFVKGNLALARITEPELAKTLHQNGVNNYKKTALVMLDNNGGLYIQPRGGKFKTAQYNLSKEATW